MQLAITIIEVLVIVGAPALILFLCRRVKLLRSIGAIVLCYALGIVLALFTLIPGFDYDKDLSNTITSLVIPVAIPLLLISFSLKSVRHLAKKTLIGFLCICVSVVVASVAVFFVGGKLLENTPYYSAMAIGLYTGGTPNLFAVGKALGLDADSINLANLSDLVIGGLFVLFLFTFAKRVYGKILDRKPKRASETVAEDETRDVAAVEAPEIDRNTLTTDEYSFSDVPKTAKGIFRLIGVLLLGVACLGIGAVLAMAVSGDWNIGRIGNSELHEWDILIIMLTVTTLGIAFSFVKPIRETKGTYQSGQYLILVFSLALSMSIDFTRFGQILGVLAYMVCIFAVSVVLHILLCLLFRIDGDTAIITSTAGLYGPAFIPSVAGAIKNDALVVPGLICGILGYVIGNYLGIGVGWLLLLV